MDPVCDMLNRIRNAQAVSKEMVTFNFSNLKYKLGKILEEKGFIGEIKKKGKGVKGTVEIALKYSGGEPAISGIKRVSRPGQRIYKSFKELRAVKSGYGISIISTSKGLLTDKEARKQKVGGEVICEIW